MTRPIAAVLTAALLPGVAAAKRDGRCEEIVARLASALADVECFESADLTTRGSNTTPPNDSIAGLPPLAFTPVTDRGVIAPGPADQTPITRAVPGIQLEARVANDATGEARFLLRLPDDWNGRLVVAGASGTRSEFNGDLAWSDYVIQRGYAYASQNKGMLNLFLSAATDPLACRLNPDSPVHVHFYANDPANAFTEWAERMVEAGRLARDGVKARYGHAPRRTYAVGTSNGGYQVRRAVEEAPSLFDGGVDWEGTFVGPAEHNLLVQLPAAIRWFPEYRASDYDPASAAAMAIRAAGYPPDLVNRDGSGEVTASLWLNHWNSFWEVTQCQWQKRLDPTYDTYGDGTGAYDYFARAAATDVDARIRAFATPGRSSGRSSPSPGRWTRSCPPSTTRAPTPRPSMPRAAGTTPTDARSTATTRSRTGTTSRRIAPRSRSSSSSSRTRIARSTCSSRTSSTARRCRPTSASRAEDRSRRFRHGEARAPSCSRPDGHLGRRREGPTARESRPVAARCRRRHRPKEPGARRRAARRHERAGHPQRPRPPRRAAAAGGKLAPPIDRKERLEILLDDAFQRAFDTKESPAGRARPSPPSRTRAPRRVSRRGRPRPSSLVRPGAPAPRPAGGGAGCPRTAA
jgi:hypothetical protein